VTVLIGDNNFMHDLIDVYAEDSLKPALNIGWLSLDKKYTYDGIVDEVAIYNRALSDGMILGHYNLGLEGKGYCEEWAHCQVTFYTDPAGLGFNITFHGQTYDNDTTGMFSCGTSGLATANSPTGYVFDRWETAGEVSVADANVNPATITVSGNGTVTAMYTEGQYWNFDFGTTSSPIASGYIGVNNSSFYDSSIGYGWTDTLGLVSRDRGAPDNLRRDFVFSASDHTFNVDLPNGEYQVTLVIGDYSYQHDMINVYAEEILTVNDLTVPKGTFNEVAFPVMVGDGQLNIRFHDDGGLDGNWVINAVLIDG